MPARGADVQFLPAAGHRGPFHFLSILIISVHV